MSKEGTSKELEEFILLEKFQGNLKMVFMGMKANVKYVGTPAINKAQTIGKIGMAPEKGVQSVIFYSKDDKNVEIITTTGENEGESSTDKQVYAILNSSVTAEDLYQKHLSLIQGRMLKKLEKFQKQAKKIPEDMMKAFSNQMNEIGDIFSKIADNLK